MKIIYLKKLRNTLIFSIAIILLFILILSILKNSIKPHKNYVIGAVLYKIQHTNIISTNNSSINVVERYFRPSKLPVLNTRTDVYGLFSDISSEDINKNIIVPEKYMKTPEDTIINYFSVLMHAANMTDDKYGGCGTVGQAKTPYPAAYAFFTPQYRKKNSFNAYVDSFEGFGHINLIKYHAVPKDDLHPDSLKYFFEIETIEGTSEGTTNFNYYYGFMYLTKINNSYMIEDIQLYQQDFLCAAYHGWYHDAEFNVEIRYGNWCKLIKKRHPTITDGYIKEIPFSGTDGNEYLIEFFELTNGTDIEIAQYRKDKDGKWVLYKMNPEDCLPKKN